MRTRARIEWPAKPPLQNVAIELHELDDRSGEPRSRSWWGSFSISPGDLRSIDLEADKIRITLEDGRSGDAIPSFQNNEVSFRGAGPLE
jgi:hypothetical protein